MTKRRYKTHLVIGDAHSNPRVSNRRFDWLANFIEDKQPDVIVDIGDWGDFDSISKYSKGNGASWNQSWLSDVNAFKDASRRAFGGISKIKGYTPSIWRLGGNHDEGRIDKFINENPELRGVIGLHSLELTEYDARYSFFRGIATIDGISYSHFFYDRDARYPIGTARAVLQKKLTSSTWGHSHVRDFCEGVNSQGKRAIALNVGCFLDPNQSMDYAGAQARSRWWSGLVLKNEVNNGEYEPEFWSMRRIKEMYS